MTITYQLFQTMNHVNILLILNLLKYITLNDFNKQVLTFCKSDVAQLFWSSFEHIFKVVMLTNFKMIVFDIKNPKK